jgi:hypothetical protein
MIDAVADERRVYTYICMFIHTYKSTPAQTDSSIYVCLFVCEYVRRNVREWLLSHNESICARYVCACMLEGMYVKAFFHTTSSACVQEGG